MGKSSKKLISPTFFYQQIIELKSRKWRFTGWGNPVGSLNGWCCRCKYVQVAVAVCISTIESNYLSKYTNIFGKHPGNEEQNVTSITFDLHLIIWSSSINSFRRQQNLKKVINYHVEVPRKNTNRLLININKIAELKTNNQYWNTLRKACDLVEEVINWLVVDKGFFQLITFCVLKLRQLLEIFKVDHALTYRILMLIRASRKISYNLAK